MLPSEIHNAWHSMLMTQRNLARGKKKKKQWEKTCLTEFNPIFQKSILSIDTFLHGLLLKVPKEDSLETQVWI